MSENIPSRSIHYALILENSPDLPVAKRARQMTFTERSFRDALGLFPTGVAVVTTVTTDGARIGATVSSFNSVSLSPPLVLFSIARTSRSFAAWTTADTYAVNLLHEHQHAFSTRFAR